MKKQTSFLLALSLILSGLFLLSCKKDSGSGGSTTPRATNVPDELVAAWYYGDVSTTEVYSNGSWSNAVGSGQSYTFHKDGTFEYGYRNYAMVGSCSNIGVAYRKGTFTIDDHKLTLYDGYSKIMEEHSCNPSSNFDKDGQKYTEVLYYELATDDYGNAGINLRGENTNFPFFTKK